jgi:hypothetical protein
MLAPPTPKQENKKAGLGVYLLGPGLLPPKTATRQEHRRGAFAKSRLRRLPPPFPPPACQELPSDSSTGQESTVLEVGFLSFFLLPFFFVKEELGFSSPRRNLEFLIRSLSVKVAGFRPGHGGTLAVFLCEV